MAGGESLQVRHLFMVCRLQVGLHKKALKELERAYGQGSSVVAIQISADRERIADFCQRHHIRRLALFGSALRADFNSESDVDVLVEFEEGHTPGWELFDLEQELTDILGRRVDLNTPGLLSRSFRQRVLDEAQDLYAG